MSGDDRLPGDPSPGERLARMIRVDHAGEYGAIRIYQGQRAVLRHARSAAVLQQMQAQEQRHLDVFADLVVRHRVRPTALLPVWHVAGFALGALTAALGERAAMACTVAVEDAIDTHYRAQAASLDAEDGTLRDTIESFRAEELEHRAIGLAHDAERTPGYRLLTAAIRAGCRAAIRISERL